MYSRALHIKASKQAPFDLFPVGWVVGREDGKRVLEMHICIKLRPLGQEVEGPSLCESHDENACAADACLPACPRPACRLSCPPSPYDCPYRRRW